MAYALTSTFAAPLMGMLADRFGRRPIILLSLAASVLEFSGYLFAASAWLLILLRGLAGFFTAGLLPAMTGVFCSGITMKSGQGLRPFLIEFIGNSSKIKACPCPQS